MRGVIANAGACLKLMNVNKSEDTQDNLESFQVLVKRVVIGVAAFFFIIVAIHLYNFIVTGKADQEAFAQFGDYVGGLLNPVLGFSTVLLLIYSIRIQAKELKNTSEDLRLTRLEMERANIEARKSAEAMLKQSMLMERRDKLKEVYLSLDVYKSQLERYKNKTWHVDRQHLKPIESPAGLKPMISYNELIKLDRVKHNLLIEYCIKYFNHLKYVIGLSIFKDFNDQIQALYYKQAECIGKLIRYGASHRQCELETHRLYDELLFAEQLELLVGTDLNEPLKHKVT